MKYIVINGHGTCGKDEFIKIFDELYSSTVHNISSIDPIKDIAFIGGWSGEKDNKSRKLLSDLKKLFIDYNNLPTKFLCGYCDECKNRDDYNHSVIFMHVREPSEIEKLKLIFNDVITILIDKDIESVGNSSDDGVMDYKYDYYIDNNGSLSELKDSVETFINEEF